MSLSWKPLTALTVLIATAAIASTAVSGYAAQAQEEDWGGIKQAACQSFGCAGGPRNCFDGQVELNHPVYGGVSVHLWCYEP
ncbi:MAG: hypothetical protein U0974_01690 [Gemmatimonadales bacterium]|nr:hypothetical protein [Gemmatimonadales bacterium]MDZ4388429.1 hypothetical protein [Gemmatimonadales bacterium]